MSIEIDLQICCTDKNLPTLAQLQTWVDTALIPHVAQGSVCIRLVDQAEITQLNQHYRDKNRATNVLSFPADLPTEFMFDKTEKPLGDLVICAEIVAQEASQQHKPLIAHWAHLVIHGSLHLLGFDHISAKDAAIMEPLEIDYLNRLGFANPYGTEEKQ